MEVLLKQFYKHLYDLSEAYYCDQYSTACYESEIKKYFLLAKSLKEFNSSESVHEVILESSFFGDEVKPYDTDHNPYVGCVCSLDGTCIQGTLEESANFLLDLALAKSPSYKRFELNLGIGC